jgi:hypothetical protein
MNKTAAHEAWWHLLIRYLWPYSYFRDVSRGSLLERQQAYRFNRRMGIYLPGFMFKWALLTAFFFVLGTLCDELLDIVLPAACCFVTGTWTLTVVIQLTIAWVWFKHFPELH